jgi:hypothetical protein
LNETLARVFKDIEGSAIGADSEDDFKGLFDDLDVNSAKLGPTVARRNGKLVKLLDAIGDLDLGAYSEHAIDTFGDAYEYLMQMYASTVGKSGGEFFTPQEVSELLARIRPIQSSGMATPTRYSSTTRASRPPVCSRPKARQTWLLPCTCSVGSPSTAQRPSSNFPACSIAAAQSRKSANTSSTTTTSMQ